MNNTAEYGGGSKNVFFYFFEDGKRLRSFFYFEGVKLVENG